MKCVGVIGVGNLGKRLTGLMCKNNLELFLTVSDVDTELANSIATDYGIDSASNCDNIQVSDVLFLAVKPDEVKSVCDEIKTCHDESKTKEKIIVSTAAGVPSSLISKWIDHKHVVLRCMPNLPISDGNGSIIWYDHETHNSSKSLYNNGSSTHDAHHFVEDVTQGPSKYWVNSEHLVDVATVLSSCNPAYAAKILGNYIDIGTQMGFTGVMSKKLVIDSFEGTIHMLKTNDIETIIDQVTSKGGATEKGLEKLITLDKILQESSNVSLDHIKNITKKFYD